MGKIIVLLRFIGISFADRERVQLFGGDGGLRGNPGTLGQLVAEGDSSDINFSFHILMLISV